MPSVTQYLNVLGQKIAPSAWIQRRGSVNQAIRSSSMFGPQINTQSFQSFQHSQNPILHNQLKNMDK